MGKILITKERQARLDAAAELKAAHEASYAGLSFEDWPDYGIKELRELNDSRKYKSEEVRNAQKDWLKALAPLDDISRRTAVKKHKLICYQKKQENQGNQNTGVVWFVFFNPFAILYFIWLLCQ